MGKVKSTGIQEKLKSKLTKLLEHLAANLCHSHQEMFSNNLVEIHNSWEFQELKQSKSVLMNS